MAEVTSVFVPQGDFVTSTLIGAITNASTSFTIGSGLSLDTTGGLLQLDYDSVLGLGVDGGPETIAYTSYNSATGVVSGVTRAQAATTAVAHANGATVQSAPSSKYFLNGNLLGYAQITSNFTSTATPTVTDVTNLSVTVSVPTLASTRYLVVEAFTPGAFVNSAAGSAWDLFLREGSTTLQAANQIQSVQGAASVIVPTMLKAYLSGVSSGSHTYKVSFDQAVAGTFTLKAGSTAPAYIAVYLI